MPLLDKLSQPDQPSLPIGESVPLLADKVSFLASPEAYVHPPAEVEVRETHMSWLFLVGSRVYKLKKPLRRPFLDLSTVDKRGHNCKTELRLNRRLAGDVYIRTLPLRVDDRGELTLGAKGEIVDWLVEMKRLPAADMLDERIRQGRVGDDEIVSLADCLAALYQSEAPQVDDGHAYLKHIETESRLNRALLLQPRFGMDREKVSTILDRVDALIQHWTPAIRERIAQGRIIEGHGDLRPEHVCLGHPPRVIDCLEFDRNMRLLDPYDEANYLGLECEFIGAGWIRPLLLSQLDEIIGHRPNSQLIATYGGFRATLRARICIAHLIDANPTEPQRWQDETQRYLSMAADECVMAEG